MAAPLGPPHHSWTFREQHLHTCYSHVPSHCPPEPRPSQRLHACFLRDTRSAHRWAGQARDDRWTQQAQAWRMRERGPPRGPKHRLHSPLCYRPVSTSSCHLGKDHRSLEDSAVSSAFTHGRAEGEGRGRTPFCFTRRRLSLTPSTQGLWGNRTRDRAHRTRVTWDRRHLTREHRTPPE